MFCFCHCENLHASICLSHSWIFPIKDISLFFITFFFCILKLHRLSSTLIKQNLMVGYYLQMILKLMTKSFSHQLTNNVGMFWFLTSFIMYNVHWLSCVWPPSMKTLWFSYTRLGRKASNLVTDLNNLPSVFKIETDLEDLQYPTFLPSFDKTDMPFFPRGRVFWHF